MMNKDGGGQFLDFMGGHSCYEGGHGAHGGPPSPPHWGKPWSGKMNILTISAASAIKNHYSY